MAHRVTGGADISDQGGDRGGIEGSDWPGSACDQ